MILQQLSDLSLACLSLLVQLYGGDHPNTFTVQNMKCLSSALHCANHKTQRILLKVNIVFSF